MRSPLHLVAGLLLLTVAPAAAQVTLDLHALDQGQGQGQPAQPGNQPDSGRPQGLAKPLPRRPAHPVARKPGDKPDAAKPASTSQPQPNRTARPAAPAANLPVAPPTGVTLAPIVPPPPQGKPEPPPTPPIAADAGGGAEPIPHGLRVLFAPSRTDLTAATEASITAYLGSVPKTENTSFDVTAYAAGGPEDPSTPRRLSLSRALAVRSVLMADGIGSARIYLRALGAGAAGGPADRVDVVALGTNGSAKADAPR